MPPIRRRTASPISPCGSSPKSPGGGSSGPSVAIRGDYILPDAAPLPLAHGLLAAEMGMNLQMALGQKRYLLLHAATVEKDGRALIMTGESGAGKSTLAALLGERGWRLMGDEFALLDLATGALHAVPARGQPQERRDRGDGGGGAPTRFGPRARGHAEGRDPPFAPQRGARSRRMGEAARRRR